MTTPKTTLRSRSVLLAAAVLAFTFTGCSAADSAENTAPAPAQDSAGSSGPSEPGGSNLLPPAEGKTKYPLTLSTPWGETILEERPERIAAVDPSGRTVELLEMLDVTAIAAPSTLASEEAWVDVEPETVYEITRDEQYPLESIAAADPDLIIILGGYDPTNSFDQLAAIAPVLGGETMEEFTSDWQTRIRLVGETIDLSDAAEEKIQEHDDYFAEVRAEHPEFQGKTVTYALYYGEEFGGLRYLSTPGSASENFFTELGFDANPTAEQFATDNLVSPENIALLDADILILGDTSNGQITSITDQALFQNLKAVAGKHLVQLGVTATGFTSNDKEIEGNLAWALAGSGSLGQQWAAEHLVSLLKDAL